MKSISYLSSLKEGIGGIGEALCLKLRQEGYNVFATARNVASIDKAVLDAGCDVSFPNKASTFCLVLPGIAPRC